MHKITKNILIFILIFIYFFLIQGTTHFADPDCFYHTKMAILMQDNLIFKEFPWLQLSVLKENYIDHHFLYHIFLMPFVSLDKIGVSPLLGVNISAMFFATLLIFVFYLVLKKFKIRYALVFVFIVLISTGFIFRISLARAPAVSGIFLLLGTYFILQNKTTHSKQISYWPLFLTSFFYVWLYSAWLLLPVMLFFYLIASTICQQINKNKIHLISRLLAAITENKNKIIACLSGLTVGLIINPYFPKNIKFYYHQIYQIAIVNFHHQFQVGGEWYPSEPVILIKKMVVFFVILMSAVALFFVFAKKQNKRSWTLFLTTTFFFLYTIKARRSVEYLVPFGVLLTAFVWDNVFQKKSWPALEQKFKTLLDHQRKLALIIPLYIFVLIAPYFIYHDIIQVHKDLQNFKFNHLQKVSQWIKQNVEPAQTIFNSNWDDFGFLFYNNSQNYYITGLDQTFMHSFNPDLHLLYIDITKGQNVINLKHNLTDKFNSEYILVSQKRNQKLYENLTLLKNDFEMVYEDGEASVFKVKKND